MALKIFLLLMFAIAVEKSTGIAISATDCGSVLGKFSDLEINCDEGSTAEDCKLSIGKKYTGSLKVTPNTAINKAKIVLHAIIGRATLPFPFPDNDLCKNHNVVCPLKADTQYTVEIELDIPSYAPKVNFEAKMEFQSGGEDLVCLKFIGTLQ